MLCSVRFDFEFTFDKTIQLDVDFNERIHPQRVTFFGGVSLLKRKEGYPCE